MNLSTSTQNGHSLNKSSIFNVSDSSDGSTNSSVHLVSSSTSPSTNGAKVAMSTNTNANANVNTNMNFITNTSLTAITNANPNVNLNTITNNNPQVIPNTISNISNTGSFRRPRQVFTMEQENQLADYVRETSNYYSGLSSKEVRIMAFVYGVCNQVEMPTGWHETHQASFDWCVGFIKRTKLPSTMITGISSKGSTKQSKITSSEPKLNKVVPPHVNGSSVKSNDKNINNTPIEID